MSQMYRDTGKTVLALIALLLGVSTALAQSDTGGLTSGFENPPDSASPRVWWHWMNGNVTKEGIKLDLEWMHRVGIRGFQNFDAALATPIVVKKRLAYMTPEWKDAFKYAIEVGDQMGMEMAIAGSPGWSESGGPWVPASQGMKKYVWSETRVEGGRPFTGTLAHPPTNTGAFQNMAVQDVMSPSGGSKPVPQFYRDVAVIAYRAAASDVPLESLHPKVTASGGNIDAAMLSDGDLVKTTKLPIPAAGQSAWIQFEFAEPQAIRGVSIVTKSVGSLAATLAGIASPKKTLEASDDGRVFRDIVILPEEGCPEHTASFPAVAAKYFRVVFERTPPPPLPAWAEGLDAESMGIPVGTLPTDYEIAELVLHPGARVNRFEDKAAFSPVPDLYPFATPSIAPADAVSKSDVVDLTSKMYPDGRLNWTPPAGRWVILRFGYSLLGITNHPATPEATGLEVDKLNHNYVKNYMETYLESYKQTVGAGMMGKRGIRYVINDSWEAGSQNWTDGMLEQFKRLRGYDALPWLPVLAGRVVESAEASDRFLWDFRKTISDLIANEHYAQLEATLHEWHMGHYGESHEDGRTFVADGMEVKKFNEVPMSAMWTQRPGVNKELYVYDADDREAASVAHIYGQNLAAAESLTAAQAPWAWSPATLKPTADQEFLNGINRFVISVCVHQPLEPDKAPGMTLGPFGQWLDRKDTWAEEAGPWMKYLARLSYLLQQGHFGADVVYFYGEDSNLTAIFAHKAPDAPAGYGFDYINADGLIHMLSAREGRITTKSGMQYRLLALDPYSQHMSLPVLRAIHKLVEDGAAVAGPKPTDDPSLADDQAKFLRLNDELFGDGTGVHKVGKGTVYAGQNAEEALEAMNVSPDFEHTKPESDTRLAFVHRRLAAGDLYFVDNRNDRDETVEATFRVAGKAAELWHPDTGQMEPASYRIAEGRTTVPLHLEPWGTVFVVLRKPAQETSRTLPKAVERELAAVEGPWKVALEPGRGAPESITLDSLISWSDSADAGVKYFSGTGTYTKTVQASPGWFKKGTKLWLNLGDVKNLAAVTVNGKSLGIVWHTPYRVEVTTVLKPGANEVKIKVINAWVNRLIGDQQPGATKYTFADVTPYRANSPLLSSGLLGPVHIYSEAAE